MPTVLRAGRPKHSHSMKSHMADLAALSTSMATEGISIDELGMEPVRSWRIRRALVCGRSNASVTEQCSLHYRASA